MFDISFGEIAVLLLLAIVVAGPRQLPKMLRTLGRWITRIRRIAFDMRNQSGIDDILRDEGLDKDIQTVRSLMMRKSNVISALAINVDDEIEKGERERAERAQGTVSSDDDDMMLGSKEYPLAGTDAYGAHPEDMDPYVPSEEQGDD